MSSNVNFAHIGSLGTYSILSSFCDIGMFQAHLIQCDNNYAYFCKQQSKRYYTILDSGALEVALGIENIEVSDNILIEMSFAVSASEVVCPDCPADPLKSIIRSKEFIRIWQLIPKNIRPNLMIVPHGYTVNKWLSNAEELISLAKSCVVGIPRLLAQICGQGFPRFRIDLAERIVSKYPGISVHLLGAGDNILDEVALFKNTSSIRSIDSTFIHRYLISGEDPLTKYSPPHSLRSYKIPDRCLQRIRFLDGIMKIKTERGYSVA